MAFDFDLFVIGGGSGGVRAARTAAATGARVGLAEEYRMGGTCVIRGCVPKKLMVYASAYPRSIEDAAAYGWKTEMGSFDWPHFRRTLHGELDRLEKVYREMLGKSDVEIFDSRARLVDAHTVELADGTRKSAAHVLVATGGHPVRPDLPNAHMGMVSNDIFRMETLPKSILIIGGGYIACEFACILSGLGVEVTQYYRGAQVLRGFDDEARGLVAEMMQAQGIDLHVGTNIVEMAPAGESSLSSSGGTASDAAGGAPVGQSVGTGGGETRNLEVNDPFEDNGPLRVKSTNGGERVFDAVLFATGRAPNTRGLGLEEAGVKLGRKGEIVVDDYSQTSVPSIYAIGDVTDRMALTPVAIREGAAFTATVFEGRPTKVDHDLVPSAIFTQPELGTVGMTEEEGMERGGVEVYSTSFKAMQQAFAGRTDRVLMKLVVDSESRKVLGCHIVSEMAGEMIQLAGIAVKMGATKEQFDQTCAVHPTMAEELVTMKSPVRRA